MDQPTEVQRIEIALLLEGIFQRYGYDFRNYSRKSVERRLTQFLADSGHDSHLEVTARALRDTEFFHRLLAYFSISVTSLFRTPELYRSMRELVVPLLRTWPHIKIWDAGCATGEEVYSLAIMLQEEGSLSRTRLYATDISQSALDTARTGVYSLEILRQGSINYHQAGGHGSLSDYYTARYNAAVMDTRLKKHMTFARHNLAMDQSFGEMQAIVCRNVLIYFNDELQNHVLELFHQSLDRGGFLCLGKNESLRFSSVVDRFDVVCEKAHIYKKRRFS